MSQAQSSTTGKIRLGFRKALGILRPYIIGRFLEQLKSVWIIIVYLILFQLIVLRVPIVYSFTIGIGLFIVLIGLMFFMEGLMLGLMPLGEILGTKLPVKSKLPTILVFSFLLGMAATFAEPAIAVLKEAGSSIEAAEAPLLFSLLNEFSAQVVLAVGIGVGLAVMLGVLRFMFGWSLKLFIIPLVLLLSVLTIFAHLNPVINPIIGLAWDCGGVTTGPVTVPLVLALGIGVCRVVNTNDSGDAGFGIVTLASLFPIIFVLLLGTYHFYAEDYSGADKSAGLVTLTNTGTTDSEPVVGQYEQFTEQELHEFKATGKLPKHYVTTIKSDSAYLVDGKIVVPHPVVIYNKVVKNSLNEVTVKKWLTGLNTIQKLMQSILNALQAIIPLCLFLFLMLRFVLKEKVPFGDEISLGIGFAVIGMAIFGMGISIGLTPLGTQLGSNIPSAFTRIKLWNLDDYYGPLFDELGGKLTAILFGFLLGYGATLAEPALNALGTTVEKITVGAFRKSLLMQTVAIGVGIGISLGVVKIAFNIPLTYILIPLYILLIPLTIISKETFVNFAWDSAGVTTGPITVPLVLAMGLGIGSNIPGIVEGFGILALASVTPIIAVLAIGFMVSAQRQTT